MHSEIERKFLFEGSYKDLADVVLNSAVNIDIEDYYFNKYTRYRWVNDKCWVGIKSAGTLIRDEEECMLAVTPNKEDYAPRLIKRRHKFMYGEHVFEVNIYKDICLALVEVELERADEDLILPYWCGEEVTNNEKYYNYNLWGELSGRYNTISKSSENKQFNI